MTTNLHLVQRMGVLIAVGGLMVLSPVTMALAGTAYPVRLARSYTYSADLISRYTAGCTPKVQSTGKSLAQAKQLCECSINQMQQQRSQGSAVALLIGSQFSSSKDPKTGLPLSLSKYFIPCMS